MPDFIWILSRDKAASLGEVGVASSYILPRADVGESASELMGNVIWVLLRGENDRLALVIKVQGIYRILDGYHKDDFMIHPDLQKSLKIGSLYNQLASYVTDVSTSAREGISAIAQNDIEKLSRLLKTNIAVRLMPPSKKIISNFIVENPSRDHNLLARMVTQIAVSSFNFVDIFSDGRHKKYRLAPFASIAKAYMKTNFPSINFLEIDDQLVCSDPYASILNRKFEREVTTNMAVACAQAPRVDAIFMTIDPDKIFAREFTASCVAPFNPLDRIKKTEVAEKRHQEILRDISRFLLGEGIQSFQSESVDLAYNLSGKLYVFEIKTANLENAISQASKGAFQLACYKNALISHYGPIVISLLLEDTGSTNVNEFIFETLQTLGICAYFYNGALAWPHRVANLPLK